MPLDPLGPIGGVSVFLSNWCNQLVNLLTGQMTDQPVTLADGLTVKGGFVSSGGSSFSGNLFVAGTITSSQTLTGSSKLDVTSSATLSGGARVLSGLTSSGGSSFYGGETISSGNLSFTDTGQRIKGDFSNATQSNRTMFQDNSSNNNTIVGFITGSSAGICRLNLFTTNNPDTGVSVGSLAAFSSVAVQVVSTNNGGTTLPLQLVIESTAYLTIPTAGGVQVNQGGFTVSSGGSSFYGGAVISSGNLSVTLGTVSATTSGATTTFSLTDTGGNGANLLFTGNGSTPNKKYVRTTGGTYQILNDAYTVALFQLTDTGTMATASALSIEANETSSQRTALTMGSAGPQIQFGSSVPNSACRVGSLFMNVGGSSTSTAYLCMPNSGGASSSNWAPITVG